jgi:signal transduction histidine kinase
LKYRKSAFDPLRTPLKEISCLVTRLRYNRFPELSDILNWTSPQFSFRRLTVAHARSEDIFADFAHQLRQPLSALEALTSYLDLITTPGDLRVREQLLRMHSEIVHADQILQEGLRALRGYLAAQGPVFGTEPAVTPEGVVEELSRPLTNAVMAAVTY